MDSSTFQLTSLRQDITEHNLQLKALIQDINACVGPLSDLQNLNDAGRTKIAALRKFIDKFGDVAKETREKELLKEVVLFREQLSSSMEAFKKANIKSMLAIEKSSKEELLKPANEQAALRLRTKRDQESLAKVSSTVTEQLQSISRLLADTTKRSAQTLDTLVVSSDNVQGTQEELKAASGAITQSNKLLAKYGRREFTDKILYVLGFAFFIACMLYILQKRLL